MTDYYRIRSPLSQITEERADRFIASIEQAVGEKMHLVSLDEYLDDDFALLYVASGGSEGYFLEIFDRLKDRHCFILTSGESNSLAASMEILSYLRKHGGSGVILHGDTGEIARQIRAFHSAQTALSSLCGKKLGCIGKPSDWLIASDYSPETVLEKLGLGFVFVSMEELMDEIAIDRYEENEYTRLFLQQDFDPAETRKALAVYGAFERLVKRYGLLGVSVRCFELLDSVRSTGCLGLSILNSLGVYAACEGDMPSLLSMAILGSITKEPMFMCNPSRFDTKAGCAVFAHCTAPTSMLKSFCLNTHFESGIGVAVQGEFALEGCTLFKCEGDLSRHFVQEGSILKADFDEMLCRTQIKVKLDDFSYFLNRPISNHHIICRGHRAAEVEAFFRLLDRA
jgi:L-fucose isomerase and related proteins